MRLCQNSAEFIGIFTYKGCAGLGVTRYIPKHLHLFLLYSRGELSVLPRGFQLNSIVPGLIVC